MLTYSLIKYIHIKETNSILVSKKFSWYNAYTHSFLRPIPLKVTGSSLKIFIVV